MPHCLVCQQKSYAEAELILRKKATNLDISEPDSARKSMLEFLNIESNGSHIFSKPIK